MASSHDEQRIGASLLASDAKRGIDLARCRGVENLKIACPTARAAASMSLSVVSGFGALAGLTSTATRAGGWAPSPATAPAALAVSSAWKKLTPGDVSARPRQAGDKPEPDGIARRRRTRSGSSLSPPWQPAWQRRAATRHDDVDLPRDEVGRIAPASDRIRPSAQRYSIATFSALDESGFVQALPEARNRCCHSSGRPCDRGIRCTGIARLLRARRERPRRRAAEQRDELAPLHSITSSARASSDGGTSRPSALAVLRLMTSSYLVGACTGKSAGFSPLRMRST